MGDVELRTSTPDVDKRWPTFLARGRDRTRVAVCRSGRRLRDAPQRCEWRESSPRRLGRAASQARQPSSDSSHLHMSRCTTWESSARKEATRAERGSRACVRLQAVPSVSVQVPETDKMDAPDPRKTAREDGCISSLGAGRARRASERTMATIRQMPTQATRIKRTRKR